MFETVIFIFRICIYALAVLQRQGEAEEPRVLLHSTGGSLRKEVIADLNLDLLRRGFLTRNQCPADPKHSIGMCCIRGTMGQVKFPQSIWQRRGLQGEPVVRMSQGVRAGLVVPASRVQRFRKTTQTLLGETPPLIKDQQQ